MPLHQNNVPDNARRHGNRLDAADKRWHLSSPTPYDPPLTYGGWSQARATGNQISSYLEQAKIDAESPSSQSRKRKRFKVIIHSSPFLRCLQTSIAIASGLSQTSGETSLQPSDIFASIATPPAKTENSFRSSILRVDSYLGEWLSHEYFENITPPPASNMMLGTAKVALLKNEDYSAYTDFAATAPQAPRKSSLWNASPSGSSTPAAEGDGAFGISGMTGALPGSPGERKGYGPPRPTYAVSSAGKIPDGFVAHARDQCTSVDYQWDSLREPNGFGDGGTLGEEWTAMHKRFRRGLKRALNWYATTERPDKISGSPGGYEGPPLGNEEEEIETVVIIVSHGAGCNAMIGAITHQPVLMDVGIASITMAMRKPNLDYEALRQAQATKDPGAPPLVPVDQLYDIRLSASTEHLRSTGSTPVSSRSSSVANNVWSGNAGARGRTATLGSSMAPSLAQFTYNDPLASPGSRSTSANAVIVGGVGTSFKRDAAPPPRPTAKQTAMSSIGGIFSGPGGNSGVPSGPPVTTTASPSLGLWSPAPSSLRIMDDGKGDDQDDYGGFIDFGKTKFKPQTPQGEHPPVLPLSQSQPSQQAPISSDAPPALAKTPKAPRLAAPIKLQTSWDSAKVPQEVTAAANDPEAGPNALWGRPRSPDLEVSRDTTASKRRWTVNERPC